MARTKQTARKETVALLKYKEALIEKRKRLHEEEEKLQQELKKEAEAPAPPADLKRLKKSSEVDCALKILSDGSYIAFKIEEEEGFFGGEAEEVPPALISDDGESEPSDAESVDSEIWHKCPDCDCENYPNCCYIKSDGEHGDACDTCIDGADGHHRWEGISESDDDESDDSFVVPDHVIVYK